MAAFSGILRWIDLYASTGLQNVSEGSTSRLYAFNIYSLLGGIFAVLYGLAAALYDFDGLYLVSVTSFAGMSFLLLPLVTHINPGLAISIGTALVIALFGVQTYLLGAASGLFLYMNAGILGGLMMLGVEKLRLIVALCASAAAGMIYAYLAFQSPAAGAAADPALQRAVFSSVLVILPVMIVAGMLTLSFRLARAEAELAEAHAQSEALLRNLLPDQIAARLKDRPGQGIADGLPAVSLLFADIVGFTARAATRSPEDVVAFLNRIFSRFDELTAERGLEKIKTIGDAYMVAAGLPVARDDHAEIIADMALAMQDAVAELSREMGEKVELRIGVHSGPAIAGVIGTSKVFYDVWGDTVNTASRMESHGLPGRIQVTDATHALLGDRYLFEDRGVIDIKGKGPLKTYWLTGRAA